MTTLCQLLILAPKAKADGVASAIAREAKRIEKKFNFFDPNSYLSRINRREVVRLDRETIFLLQLAKEFYERTEGIFDVTLATVRTALKAPTLEEFQRIKEERLPYTGVHHFTIKGERILFDNPYTLIDLGGLAKEYGVDRGARIVKANKIEGAIINFGGDLYLHGTNYGSPFRVGIRDPRAPQRYRKFMELAGGRAVATSAHYERYTTIEGREISHILSRGELSPALSTTVIAPTTVEAGVFATALAVESCLPHNYPTLILY
ncbi:MAG: FAD:protein FMN transferase [Epsilonproteobacteria bacterium]|nr:hypothetical protein [Campylobacterota bacterium]NPA57321.1 FAD:protein FMN transferase [Campylobacterota bacterium]